jgi:hypothetical protein
MMPTKPSARPKSVVSDMMVILGTVYTMIEVASTKYNNI